MNESPGKENKEPELLYRLDKRNPFMVMFDFIRFSFFLLVPALPTAIYYDGWMRILGILGSTLLIWLLYSVIFFNYVEIYRDKIVIDRFIFGNQIIKPKNIIHCRTLERAFLPAHVEIAQKTQHPYSQDDHNSRSYAQTSRRAKKPNSSYNAVGCN